MNELIDAYKMAGVAMNKKIERKHNLKLLIEMLRLFGPVAQARLKDYCNLQASTVSYLINDLKAENLVIDIGKEDTQGRVGKPGNMISLNNAEAQFLGIYVEDDGLDSYLMGIDGRTLHYSRTEYAPANVEKMICTVIEDALRLHANIRGIGITIKAIVYKDGHIKSGVRHDGNSGGNRWDLLDLPSELRARFPGVPIIVENDANCAAELYWYEQKCDNFALYLLNDRPFGIGCGLMINGKVYRGAQGAAGEFFIKDLDVEQIYADMKGKKGGLEKLLSTVLPHILQTAYLLDPERIILTGSLFSGITAQALDDAQVFLKAIPKPVVLDSGTEQTLNPAKGAAMLAINDYIDRFVEEVIKR